MATDRSIHPAWILLLCMIFAAALASFFLLRESLRLDEAQSLWQASHSPGRVLYLVAQDVHVPLYHLGLHWWQLLFGTDIEINRLFSFAFFLAAIPLTFLLGKLAYNQPVGLFATFLVTLSPFLNWYGSEIRMYSLLTFLTILNQYFFIALYKKEGPGVWVGYGLSALIGLFTHYFFALILFTQAVFYASNRSLFPKRTMEKGLALLLIAAIGLSSWLFFVYRQGLAVNAAPYLAPPNSINVFSAYSQFLFGFQNDSVNSLLLSAWPLGILISFLGLRKNAVIPKESGYFLLVATVPVLVAFLVSLFVHPIFVTRYLIICVPSLYLFLSWLLFSLRPLPGLFFRTVLVTGMAGLLALQLLSPAVPAKENYREAAAYLTDHAKPQDIAVISAPFTVYPIEYYYSGPLKIATLPLWNRDQTGPIPSFSRDRLPTEVDQLKEGHQTAWLILSYDQGYQKDIKNYFDTHFPLVDHQELSPGLTLWGYNLK